MQHIASEIMVFALAFIVFCMCLSRNPKLRAKIDSLLTRSKEVPGLSEAFFRSSLSFQCKILEKMFGVSLVTAAISLLGRLLLGPVLEGAAGDTVVASLLIAASVLLVVPMVFHVSLDLLIRAIENSFVEYEGSHLTVARDSVQLELVAEIDHPPD